MAERAETPPLVEEEEPTKPVCAAVDPDDVPSPVPRPGRAHPAFVPPNDRKQPVFTFAPDAAPAPPVDTDGKRRRWRFVYEHAQTQRLREVAVGATRTDAVDFEAPPPDDGNEGEGRHCGHDRGGTGPVRLRFSQRDYERVYRRLHRTRRAPLTESDSAAVVWAVLRDLDARCARINKRLRRIEKRLRVRSPTSGGGTPLKPTPV